MSVHGNDELLAAVLDALALMQGQLETIAQRTSRIEATHEAILHRLDTIDAGLAGVTDLVPMLETIMARAIEDRDLNRAGFAKTAEIAAFAYAAAMGNGAPLPVEVADDPLLERYTLLQPADRTSDVRALVEWQHAMKDVSAAELIELLKRQYEPSPTDTAETRVLRYRLAALTRDEIKRRGGTPPVVPGRTVTEDRSALAQMERSHDLAKLWRGGASAALFAEPELAPVLDLFASTEGERTRVIGEAQLSVKLATLHHELGGRIEAGERPSVGTDRHPKAVDREGKMVWGPER